MIQLSPNVFPLPLLTVIKTSIVSSGSSDVKHVLQHVPSSHASLSGTHLPLSSQTNPSQHIGAACFHFTPHDVDKVSIIPHTGTALSTPFILIKFNLSFLQILIVLVYVLPFLIISSLLNESE